MGERRRYAPGTFSWADLATTDATGAKAFYGALFGWEAEELSADGGMAYTMLQLEGRRVAGLYERGTEHGPPAWLSYVTVASADETTALAREAGATVIEQPFDVMDSGRLALLMDPTGAPIVLWQPREHAGAGIVNDPGAMCLNQLNTTDVDAARRFYEHTFGWRIEPSGTPEQPYWGIYNGDALNGGLMPLPPGAPGPSHWLVYFTAADLDASVGTIAELGGRTVLPPTPIPSGRIAVAVDPQGATFALFEGPVDP